MRNNAFVIEGMYRKNIFLHFVKTLYERFSFYCYYLALLNNQFIPVTKLFFVHNTSFFYCIKQCISLPQGLFVYRQRNSIVSICLLKYIIQKPSSLTWRAAYNI